MDKVNKLGSAMGKKLASKKVLGRKNQSSSGSLEQAVKSATSKELRAPDANLNQKVVDLIPSAMHTDGQKEVARILTARLEQKNPHKVFLAITLIREVLKKCHMEIAPAREEIMGEVGKVASQPMNRFDSNLSDQQRTKHAAFELLKTYGQDGHILSQPQPVSSPRASSQPQTPGSGSHQQYGAGGGTGQGNQSLDGLLETVETQTVIASSHNDLLQDMLLDKTSYEDKSPQDRALAKDVILDATKFGQSFEQLIGRLTAFDTPESNQAMTQAIEKMDILNNSLNLHKEMLQKELKGATGRPSAKSQRGTPTAASQEAGKTTGTQDAGVGNLLELQQGLDAGYPPSQGAQADPFAASNQWQTPPQSQQHSQAPSQPYGGEWGTGVQRQGSHGQNYPSSSQGQSYGAGPQGQGMPGPGQGYSQPSPQGGYNPYQQGYGQQWAGPPSSHAPPPRPWGEPQQGYGYGSQQWGGPPSSHAPQWAGPSSSSSQWGQQYPHQGYGQQPWSGPQGSHGYNAQPYGYNNYGPSPYSPDYSHQPPYRQGSGQQLEEKPAHVPPPMMEAVVTVPAKKEPQPALKKQEEIAASTPVSGAGSGRPASQSQSPVHPRTPASSKAAIKPQSYTSTPADSPSQKASNPPSQPAHDDGFGFESNAFSGTNTWAQPPGQPSGNAHHSPAPSTSSQQASSSLQPTLSSGRTQGAAGQAPAGFNAFGPPQTGGSKEAAAAPQQAADDDWDFFFSDKQNKAVPPTGDVKSKKPIDQLAMAFKEMEAKQ